MSQTQITVRITDQSIQMVSSPLLASGSKGVLQVKCSFDALWDDYGKTAVFYRNKDRVFHVVMTEDVATVPHEVLNEEGYFFFGVMGIAENTRTTEVVRLEIKQGAITLATAETEEPTPDIYRQLLIAYGRLDTAVTLEHKRLDTLVAMKPVSGALEYALQDEYINGIIRSNGASAYIDFTISGMSLVGGGHHYTDYCIQPGSGPLGPVYLETSNPDINVTMEIPNAEGWARMLIENVGNEMYTTDMETRCTAFYPQDRIFISELADVRVSRNGVTYPTAGEAVRGQFGGGSPAQLSTVTLWASSWVGSDSLYSQVVAVAGSTEHSKVDLQPSVEQLAIFHNKDVEFVAENDGGVITVYAIGDKPTQDYTMQVSITEVTA